MSGMFSVALLQVAAHCSRVQCQAGILTLSQLRALVVDEVLICSFSHLPAWAGSGQTWDRPTLKKSIALLMPSSVKQSAIRTGTVQQAAVLRSDGM